MKYSKHYSKLDKKEYTTIRRHSKGKIGDIKLEVYPDGWHHAKIMDVKRKSIIKIPTKFLLEDTGCNSRNKAIKLIKSFYEKPINEFKDKLYIYYMKKISL